MGQKTVGAMAEKGSEARVRDWSELDALFQAAVDEGELGGGVVQVWHDGALDHSAAIGWRDVASCDPMRFDTLFRIFSLTKPVTAVAMMILWDEGKWSPEDPIALHLPELADLSVMMDTHSDGVRRLARNAQPTLEHLLTHQAGFTYGFGDDPVDRAFRAAGVPIIPHDTPADEYLARLAKVPLAFEPGTEWRYGVSMDVQGIIVERLSGMSLRDFFHDRIFEPLGMNDTDFVVGPAHRGRLATLYFPDDAKLVEVTKASTLVVGENLPEVSSVDFVLPYDDRLALASGGGGLVSTAPDYLRFGRMLLGRGALDGVRILSEAAVTLMTRSHTPLRILAGRFGIAPHVLRPGYECAYNGMVITDPAAAGVALGRGTYFWDGAAGCWFWSDPENDVVIVAMIQLLADPGKLGLQSRARDIVADVLRGRRC